MGVVPSAGLVAVVVAVVARADTLAGLGALLPAFLADNFDDLLKAAADTCEALPLDVLFARAPLAGPGLRLEAAWRGGRRSLPAARALRHLQHLARADAELVLYVPGWWNTPTDESTQAIVTSLLDKHPLVLVLDTRLFFCREYVASASRIRPISILLYEFIKNLNDQGVPLSSIHVIGFSLGAHVAGVTGKLVKKGLNGKLGRITALDPAKPCFARSKYRLEKGDAKFVQVVHSSAGVLGLEVPVGHVDVYVNGVDVKQPECRNRSITLECDHAQAWKLYSASVTDYDALKGRKCSGWSELVEGRCSGDEVVLGYGCSSAARGLYLYKSPVAEGGAEARVQVFNPFDIRTWWPH